MNRTIDSIFSWVRVPSALGLVLVLACDARSGSDQDLAFRSTDTWTSTDGGSWTGTSTAATSYTSGGSYTSGSSSTEGGGSTGGDSDAGGGSYTEGGGSTGGCEGGTPCVPKLLDETAVLVPDNDNAGSGAMGCPTASMKSSITGPEAGMTCEGADCKFTYTLVFSSKLPANLLQDWNDTYSPGGPDMDPTTSDCPGQNAVTKAFLGAFGLLQAAGQASAEVDGNAMTCGWDAAAEELTCTYEIDISCDEDEDCVGGKDDPYEVEIWMQPAGSHRRTFETTFDAKVTSDEDCECKIGSVTADVADGFTYTTTLVDGTVFEWDPATNTWKKKP